MLRFVRSTLLFTAMLVLLLSLVSAVAPASAQSVQPSCTMAQLAAFVTGSLSQRSLELFEAFGTQGDALSDRQLLQYSNQSVLLVSEARRLCPQAANVALLEAAMLGQAMTVTLAYNAGTGHVVPSSTLMQIMSDGSDVMNSASALFTQWGGN